MLNLTTVDSKISPIINYFNYSSNVFKKGYSSKFIVDKDNKIIDLNIQFPNRWLYEDFEEELDEGIKSYSVFKENKIQLEKDVNIIKSKLSQLEFLKLEKYFQVNNEKR